MRTSSIGALAALCFALAFSACKRGNDIPVLTVSPSSPVIAVTSGNVVAFRILGSSDKSSLSRLTITSKRDNDFTVTVVDTSLSGSAFSWDWEYEVPHAAAAYSTKLTFDLYEEDGDRMSARRTLSVSLGATLLTETTGHQLYSRNSAIQGESAFDLEERVPVLYTVDSTRRDIQDNPASASDTQLSRSWISPAGGRMVRFNGFDYANATNVSVRNAFNSGVPLEEMSSIAVNDIIIVRLGSLPANVSHYALIRITDILDVDGTADNDRYTFNLKWAVFTE
ncbi:MAG: hypothetical protein IPK70_04105 [Flavobacteriales bacterium]|jgi:hypothetical protein|nr:hypothetical protein [Flavobacteriales bacterium]